MIIKKFTGKTEEAAREAARKELGEGIVIMNVKNAKRKGLFGAFRPKLVEVTVALEDERETMRQVRKAAEALKPQETDETKESQKEKTEMNGIAQTSHSSIEKKLDSLQTLLESQFGKEEQYGEKPGDTDGTDREEKSAASEKPGEAESAETLEQEKFFRLLYNTMLENEVDEKYANQLIEEADRNKKPNIPFDYILASIYQKMVLKFGKSEGITPADKGPKIVYFIGPTGVGKTTTIAKVASSFSVEEKKKVALITTDTYRIAAAEQLHTYANILEVPFLVAYTEEELTEAVANFREYDYIFVDTAGHSHQNEDRMELLGKFLDATKESAEQQVFLVLSATTKYSDLKRIAEQYRKVTDFQLIFTKLDETTALGSLYNLKMYTETPIAYVTCGQNVPEDIARFNPQKTVKHLLGGRH
ncbi:MAG: flagellar biosynthesis protein FlhF [Lachnospiraceae bacterium]|nr:flagellar biosynthesis protein FlhF [Lachnospiraceae bacterium]